jgi:hypothetical protein
VLELRDLLNGWRSPERPGSGTAVEDDLARLIMVDVNWYNWDLGEAACDLHHEFLRILLLDRPEAGRAWIHHDYGDQFKALAALAAHAAADDYAAYRWLQDRLDQPSDKPEWIAGRLAEDAIARIADGLLESCGLGEGDNRHRRNVVLPQLNLFASQIFLDGRRYNELAGLPAGTRDDYYVCVGSRFQFDLELNRFVWFSALSAWSAWPWSRHHAPQPPDRSLCVADVNRGLHQFFWEHLRGTLQAIIEQRLPELGHSVPRVFGRRYLPPTFYVVVPKRAPSSAIDYLADGARHGPLLQRLARTLLHAGDLHDDDVAGSVLQGELLVLRRILPNLSRPRRDDAAPNLVDEEQDAACYLIIPQHIDADGKPELQEDKARQVFDVLMNLENQAANRLFDIHTDLEIYDNHLQVYTSVANQGGALWDALVMHLPHASGKRLAKVHGAIELLAQTLIQGVNDLDQIATQIDERRAHLNETVETLVDTFDRRLNERSLNGRTSIQRSLAETGYPTRMLAYATATTEAAARAKATYNLLLSAIQSAFEERRVRESDVLEARTFRLSWVLGFLAVVTILQTLADAPIRDLTGAWRPAFYLANVAIGLYIVLAIAKTFMLSRRVGRTGSRSFRRSYGLLRQFLEEESTDRLDMRDAQRSDPGSNPAWYGRPTYDFMREVQQQLTDERAQTLAGRTVNPRERGGSWDKLDQALATRMAELWDHIFHDQELPPRRGAPGWVARRLSAAARPRWRVRRQRGEHASVEALSRRVETWCLATMLLTERPRMLYRHDLPRLTCLYRYCSRRLDGQHAPLLQGSVVSDWDYFFTMQNRDFTKRQAEQIDEWSRQDQRLTRACTALGVLEQDLRLATTMQPDERRAALRATHR